MGLKKWSSSLRSFSSQNEKHIYDEKEESVKKQQTIKFGYDDTSYYTFTAITSK